LARIAEAVQQKQVVKDTLLFQEGEKGGRFYILVEGQVEILKALGTPDERQLAVREACALLGELSLFSEDGSHTATVRALTDLELLELQREDIDGLLHREPQFAYEFIRTLSQRLVEGEDLTIRDLRRKNRELNQAYEDLRGAQKQLIEKEKYEKELEVARQIQMSMLPRKPIGIPHYNYFARIIPMIGVGGDFFDFIALDNQRFALAIGDVSDHGVPAALFMALTATLLRVEAISGASPEKVLRAVNRHLLGMNDAGMFVTLLYGILDTQTRSFQYARAGHEIPLVLSAKGKESHREHGRGQPLGLFDELTLDLGEVEIPEGSLMALYTDGITDTMNDQHIRFGVERFRKILSASINESAHAAVDRAWNELETYRGNTEQYDDLTLFILKAN
ncbi:MAG: cyclic nucleotide-binding domain-containing protein, partial [Anaerolineales bacterium]